MTILIGLPEYFKNFSFPQLTDTITIKKLWWLGFVVTVCPRSLVLFYSILNIYQSCGSGFGQKKTGSGILYLECTKIFKIILNEYYR